MTDHTILPQETLADEPENDKGSNFLLTIDHNRNSICPSSESVKEDQNTDVFNFNGSHRFLQEYFNWMFVNKKALTEDVTLSLSQNTGISCESIFKEYLKSRTSLQLLNVCFQFPGDLEFFKTNRHPSIQEMIEISEKFGITYQNVFKRFENLRRLYTEMCPKMDVCRKVRSFFGKNYKIKEKITEEKLKIVHKEFENEPSKEKLFDVGRLHLLMFKTGLSEKTIRKELLELNRLTWRMKIPGCSTVRKNLKGVHCQFSNETSKEKAIPIDSRIESPTYPMGIAVIQILNKNYEVQFDHDYLKIRNSGDLRYFLRSKIEYNSDFCPKNRHPSIREMIDIHLTTGLSYLTVFKLFQTLREKHNDPCPINDTCQKVEGFLRYQKREGVLNEKTLKIMHEEFELLDTSARSLSLGTVHLLMESTELQPIVIRSQFEEWKKLKRKR